jgi:uncharacterized protein involved in exopolysaccharide biosynthesis
MTPSREADDEQDQGSSFLAHLPAIVAQRKWYLIVPAIVLALAGVAAAFLLPATYKSTATLLVESPQLPSEIAGPPSQEIIDQRLAKIRQQVLSRPDLMEKIQRLDLYPKDRATKPLSEVIDAMRAAISLDPVSAEFQQRNGGKSSTIAFTMSYEYADPVKAQAVAQDVVEHILRIDSTKNAEQTQNTVQFLTDQQTNLRTQMTLLQDQISGIKARNGSALAANTGINMMGGGGNYDAQISQLQHDNAQLNAQRDTVKTAATRDPVVAQAEAQLAAVRAIYADSHPDVVMAKQRLAEAKALAKQNVANLPVDTIASQIAFNNSQIATLQGARARDAAHVSSVMSAQSRAPLVTEQVAQLQQRLEGLNVQFQQVSEKLMTAQAGAKMTSEQMGERLTVVDPPVVPDEPFWPSRPKFMIGGVITGLVLGLLALVGMEMWFHPIRGVDAVKAITGAAPLAAIPTIKAAPKSGLRWFQRLWPFGRRKQQAAAG